MPGRAVELDDHDALGAIDDERAALGHHRDLTHVNLLVLDEVLLAEAQLHVQRHRVGDAVADALDLGVLGFTDCVRDVLKHAVGSVDDSDREDLAEDGLKALDSALLLGIPFCR
jgi:hypothetical protein